MGKNTGKYILAVVALIAVAFVFTGGNLGSLAPGSLSTTTSTFPSTTTTTTSTGTGLSPGDQLTLTFNHRDALTLASLTEATNVKSTLVNKNGLGGWIVSGSGSGQTYTLNANDGGKAWVSWETQASGQSYIFDPARTIASSGGIIGDCTYTDIELDGTLEYVCSISTDGLQSQKALSGTKPDRTVTVMWANENTFTDNAPSDVSSIGTTPVAKYHAYIMTGTAGDVTFMSRMQYTMNSTSDSKWDASQSYIQFKTGETYSLVPGSYTDSKGVPYTTTKTTTSSTTIYEILFGYTLDKAKRIEFPVNGSGLLNIEIKTFWQMGSGDVITTTFSSDGLNEIQGATTTVTDVITNSA